MMTLIAVVAAGCSDDSHNGWKLEGSIEGAGGKMLYIETPSVQGAWYVVDSVKIDDDGEFSLPVDRPSIPEIYRARIDGEMIYLPVDSTETLTVKADISNLGMYEVEGNYAAKSVADISHKITDLRSSMTPQEIAADSTMKQYLNGIIVGEIQKGDDRGDKSGILSYYIIAVSNVDGIPFYNPLNKRDWRIIGAVANDYKTKRPDDPRAKYLEEIYIKGRGYHHAANPGAVTEIEVPEVSVIEFSLPDQSQNMQSISKLVANGKVTLLNFTSYDIPEAAYLNNVLKGLYEKYKDRGFEIVQVGVANDPYTWAHGRNGLPWITLYGDAQTVGSVLMSYGVQGLPTWYLIDRNGDIKERVTKVEDLRGSIEQLLS